MRRKLIYLMSAIALTLTVALGTVSPVAAGDPPAGFCEGKVALVFGPSNPMPSQAPCNIAGTYAVVDPWSDTVAKGETKRFDTWAGTKAYSGTFKGGSVWFEPKVATAPASVATGQASLSWSNWCAGISPLVFTGGGILNAGSLSSLVPSCSGGAIVVLEPWRPGCTPPADKNVNCNVGKAWLLGDWNSMVNWLVANNWTEGSLWYRPTDSVTMGAVVSTCVRALVPEGTAVNVVPGAPDPCIGVDRPPTEVASPTPVPTSTPVATTTPANTPTPTATTIVTSVPTATPVATATAAPVTPVRGFPSAWWHWAVLVLGVIVLAGGGIALGKFVL